ncbi:MAG TPA: 3-deoxy-manno-octulosonate cytidylyltransferase [Firmicutes bacterium]|nr:3-deoxy-manno-octulosonate cytidylyltransferase [Bacillota bacterium]
MTVVGIIPARYGSTRLPGKPLKLIAGKPMIEHVYRRAEKAACLSDLLVATDDLRIKEAVEAFGGKAVMTSADHQTGTDRLVEAVGYLDLGPEDIVVNIQGDEPLLDPRMIDELAQPLINDPGLVMSTLKHRITDTAEINNPNVVKVVTDLEGFALYFSRSPLPYNRTGADVPVFKHVGLYAYRKAFLLKYASMARTPLEQAESLEQLRALENGYRIKVVETHFQTIGVDSQSDLDRINKLLCGVE